MEEVTLFFKLLFARFFSNWINEHISQVRQQEISSYVWPGLIGLFLLLFVAILIEAKWKERAEISESSVGSTRANSSTSEIHSSIHGISVHYKYGKSLGLLITNLRQDGLFETGSFQIAHPKNLKVPLLISIAALFLAAVGHWPYDFYVLTRVVVFATCAILFLEIRRANRPIWTGIVLLIGLLYNPMLPIHLHRYTWVGVNFVSLITFILLYRLITPHTRSESAPLIASKELTAGIAESHTHAPTRELISNRLSAEAKSQRQIGGSRIRSKKGKQPPRA